MSSSDSSSSKTVLQSGFDVIKKIDLFRVVQDRDTHLTPKTESGAVISSVTLIIIFILLLNETYLFLTPDVRTSMFVVEQNLEKIPVHFNVSFLKMPCQHMVFEVYDQQSGQVLYDRMDSLQMSRIRLLKDSLVPLKEYFDPQPDDKSQQPTDEGCQLAGMLYLAVPGNFLFALKARRPPAFPPPADCIIHSLRFGEPLLMPKLIARFPHVDHSLFDTLSGRRLHDLEPHVTAQYFLYVIPTYFRSGDGESAQVMDVAMQYTEQHSTVFAQGLAPGLYFRYQRSALAVEYSLRHIPLSRFIVNICAVIGGVFTVMGFFVPLTELARKHVLPIVKKRIESATQVKKDDS